MNPFFISILNGCFIIPAFVFQHILCFLEVVHLLFYFFQSAFKQLFTLLICGAALGGPFHELLDLTDLQSRCFQALDHPQRLDLIITEFPDSGLSFHAGEQTFLVIITQCGNRNVEHFGNLTDRIHKIAPHIFINEA